MPLADAAAPVVLQLDLAQTIALCGTTLAALPGAAYAAAKVVVAYLEKKDKLQAERDADRDQKILDLGEAIKALTATVEENRVKDRESQERIAGAVQTETRATITSLVDLTREVVKTTGESNQQVGKLTEVVATLQSNVGGEVRRLGETVTQLGATVDHLAQSVENLLEETKAKPKRGGQ
jgi:seryl-tRNA synthetase